MSDTMTCPGCGTALPAAAAFCTNCGKALHGSAAVFEAATPSEPAQPFQDATLVDDLNAHDATRVLEPPAGDVASHAPFSTPPQAGPWAPPAADPAPAAPPPPMAAATSAPWNPPANPPAPTYVSPTPPTYDAPPAFGAPAPPAAPPTAPQPAWAPTGAAPPPTWQAPPAPAKAKRGSVLGGILGILGGLITALGAFSAWVSGSVTGSSLSGWDLTSGDKGFRLASGALLTFSSSDPYAVVGIGVVGMIVGVLLITGTARTLLRLLSVLLGIGVLVLLALDWSSLASVVADNAPSSFEITAEPGFYLTGAGGVLLILAALMPARKATS